MILEKVSLSHDFRKRKFSILIVALLSWSLFACVILLFCFYKTFSCFLKKHARGFQYSVKDPSAEIPRSFKIKGETR